MKPLSLSACLAMAATAAAAELKEPSQVASDWNKTIADARAPVLSDGPLGLSATTPGPLTFQSGPEPRRSPRPRRNGDVLEVPPNRQLDPGIQKVIPGTDTPPPGAKPWYYRGQKFWLIPISDPDVDPASPVGPLYDAPNYRVPQVLPDQQHPGPKPE